jgi:wobble nucleotide-excising tRNase
MKIKLTNCNNIDSGVIEIKEKQLNLKYAINGTGKSTIAKAILASTKDKQNGTQELNSLLPFKHRGVDDKRPEITGVNNLTNVRVFDEDYVAEFVFQPSELIKDSFDIFIRDAEYDKRMEEIDLLVEQIKKILSGDEEIERLINDFDELSGSFGRPTISGIHASSSVAKALKDGNKVVNIPKGLEQFKDYIHLPNNFRWIQWQIAGKEFIDVTENCPYCVTDIRTKKATIKRVSDEYNPKFIENLNKIVAVFQRLNEYFSDETQAVINGFITNVDGYTRDQIDYLREVRDQIDRLKEKFIKAKDIGFTSLKDVDKIVDGIKTYLIDLSLFPHLKSRKTEEKVKIVNDSLTELLNKAGTLQGNIRRQKQHIDELVKKNKEEINGFLLNAGFKYSIDLTEAENGQHRLILIHHDTETEISDVKSHLSFGERNAFALVLFTYDAVKSKPDLIILDDPISSFDRNKKFAIIDMLFRREQYLKGKTVLMLIPELDSIVDMMLVHTDRFAKPFAVFIENNKGILTEKEILKSDIKTFIEINLENIESQSNVLIKLVYQRRLDEITKKMGPEYQLISNLLHKRKDLLWIEGDIKRPMTKEEIDAGTKEIGDKIPHFNYSSVLALVRDDREMVKMYKSDIYNYEKLHIYRIIFDDKPDIIESDVFKKFVNESFHIENDHIYQLNPCNYQIIPQYIIEECNKHIEELERSTSKSLKPESTHKTNHKLSKSK